MIRLGIVGTSGMTPQDKKRLIPEHLTYVAEQVRLYIEQKLQTTPANVILVTGGAAWTEHVAVQLYLGGEFAGLELYLPSKFDIKQKRYVNTHEGRSFNAMHADCQTKTGIDVFMELMRAVSKKATKVTIQRGYQPRNTLIATNSDHLLVFTFNPDAPAENASFDSWLRSKHTNRVNIDLAIAEPKVN